jgi:mono/diheme cytochrome c family protein
LERVKSRIEKGNVEWIALARKTRGPEVLKAERYWSQEDTSYALLGYIGFNPKTGELAFFDGTYEGMQFNWNSPTIQPGGAGYADEKGRAVASKTYNATFRINCAACHDNKEPRIITPYIKQARVGYRDPERAAAFSLGDLLPERTRNSKTPYRVVGTSYTAIHKATIDGSRVVADPSRNCTSCHGLTSGGTGRFASDAVGRLGSLGDDSGVENGFRTDWALRSGAGKIHPWMNPEPQGNDLSDDPPPPLMTDADWDTLESE